jgi:hypothetical protein
MTHLKYEEPAMITQHDRGLSFAFMILSQRWWDVGSLQCVRKPWAARSRRARVN